LLQGEMETSFGAFEAPRVSSIPESAGHLRPGSPSTRGYLESFEFVSFPIKDSSNLLLASTCTPQRQ
jgi:hypothetical protein